MFFIFGWNHTKINDCGPVQEEECANCHNKDIWQLKKVSRYFTLFFVPIFPHDSENIYHCPICNHGIKLNSEEFESYKEIAQVNLDCLNKVISEEQREIKLQAVRNTIKQRLENETIKNNEDSSKWIELVNQKTTEELENIIAHKRSEFNPAFIIAAEKELKKRKTT